MKKMKNDSVLNPYVKYRNSTIILSIAVIMVSFFFFRNSAKPAVYIESRSDSLYLACQNGEELSIPYADITSLELTDDFDFGTLIEGTDNSNVRGGLWNNNQLGNYHSYIQKSINNYIILTTDTFCAVFNYESSSVTDAVYTNLRELLESKGFSDEISFSS